MSKACKVDNCWGPVSKGGFCNKHYLRNRRYGDPNIQLRKSPGTVTEEDRRLWKKRDYERHKEAYKARAARWREENPESYQKRKEEYFGREDIKERGRQRMREWARENPERKKQMDKEWRENNRPKTRAMHSRRRAAERNATPSWLTKEQHLQIIAVYEEAERLTIETGILHHVDHIVPLRGKNVSGLHVPWNLRAIPASENLSKSAKLIEDIL